MIGCKSNKQLIETFEQSEPVIIELDKEYKKIFKLKVPIGLTIRNNSVVNLSFVTINYNYTPMGKGIGIDLYDYRTLKKIKNNKKKEVSPFSKNNYLLYTRYYIDTTSIIQKNFDIYVNKMLKEEKDTLHIGTVKTFKRNHKLLFDSLTKNDNISVRLLDGSELGKKVTIPVEL